jgi:hypothetical protein
MIRQKRNLEQSKTRLFLELPPAYHDRLCFAGGKQAATLPGYEYQMELQRAPGMVGAQLFLDLGLRFIFMDVDWNPRAVPLAMMLVLRFQISLHLCACAFTGGAREIAFT